MKRILLVAILLALLCTACGQPEQAAQPVTVQQVVGHLAAAGVTCQPEDQQPHQLGTIEDAACEANGSRLNLLTFPVGVDAARWARDAQRLAGGSYVVGAGWALGTEDRALATTIADRIEGATLI